MSFLPGRILLKARDRRLQPNAEHRRPRLPTRHFRSEGNSHIK